jgi:hypothetical protein
VAGNPIARFLHLVPRLTTVRLVFVFALLFERTSDHQLRLALHVFALSVLLCLLCRRCLRCLLCSAWQDVDETSSPIRISATLPPDAITITPTSLTRAGSLALWLSGCLSSYCTTHLSVARPRRFAHPPPADCRLQNPNHREGIPPPAASPFVALHRTAQPGGNNGRGASHPRRPAEAPAAQRAEAPEEAEEDRDLVHRVPPAQAEGEEQCGIWWYSVVYQKTG